LNHHIGEFVMLESLQKYSACISPSAHSLISHHHNKQADIKVSLVKCHLSIANIHFPLWLPTSWRDSFTHLLAALSLIKPSQLFAFSGRGFIEGSVSTSICILYCLPAMPDSKLKCKTAKYGMHLNPCTNKKQS